MQCPQAIEPIGVQEQIGHHKIAIADDSQIKCPL
jgi:hypothetical protein